MYYPLVSVAVITYNQKEFLRECIESVLIQNYPNLEIVVADDASTDGTQEMLKEYEHFHPQLFKLVLADQNRGITANCNAAFFACTGKYIAWMGGDDLMLPGKIHAQVRFLEDHPDFAISAHDVDVFESASNKTIYFSSLSRRKTEKLSKSLQEGVQSLIQENFLYASSVMVRRSFCPARGYEASLKVVSDWLFWIETSQNGKIGYVHRVLGRYRKHSKNITLNHSAMDHDCLMTYEILEKKYPSYRKAIQKGRSLYLVLMGGAAIRAGNSRTGREYLLSSFLNFFHFKAVGWLLLSLFPPRFIHKVVAQYRRLLPLIH